MSLSAGERIGPYEILTVLGAGGMGQVYRARDTRGIDRCVEQPGGPARRKRRASIGSFHAIHYAPMPDGQRFLVNVPSVSQTPTVVVTNWDAVDR